ncbi:uncharacterized protein IL334_003171 [Kwoniella shivajii]|uniref:Uncharacterized protein n=1 Tax=Kwoniella shivajii TaxID=564305 RepID=A0ABZ1CWT6_9TREE|nr:hypothetical protein IL334_003171 [Kwoniella shivajii]
MATATSTMEDLIASLGGSMHVSQEAYDLKALQEYLAQTMVRPTLPLSPNISFRPIPPSRSTSSTRKPTSLPSSYANFESNVPQPYPSPMSQASFHSFTEDPSMNVTTPTLAQRPGGPLRRSSSYGFGCSVQVTPSSPPTSYSAFDADAFAPLWQQPTSSQAHAQDSWARMSNQQSSSNAFAQSQHYGGDNGGPSQACAFGAFRPPQGFGMGMNQQGFQYMGGRPPTPPDEGDEEMDEDAIDAEMDDDDEEEEDKVERVMGLSATGAGDRIPHHNQYGGQDIDIWGRGRRNF